MEFKASYVYLVMVILIVIFLFTDKNTIETPTIATGLALFLMLVVAGEQSWKAFKRQGRAAIITTLPPDDGGHDTIHPYDVKMANSPSDSKIPSFMVFATGGFVHGSMEWQGSNNFFVCPPEHVEQTSSALICRTRFRRVEFSQLQDFVQSELLQLRFFDPRIVGMKKNLWFGITSTVDGTATTNLLQAESTFLDQTDLINAYKKLLRDKDKEKKKKGDSGQPIVLNLPE